MIEFDHVSLRQEKSEYLHDISMTLHQCDFSVIAMLDTETLEAIEALLTCRAKPTCGQIRIDGRPYDLSSSILLVSTTRNSLIEPFTVGQNLYGLGGGIIFNHRKAEKACGELTRKFGFHIQADTLASNLNSEDQKLTELLRAYLKNPKVLILSELLNALSLKNLLPAKELLKEMRGKGTYVVLLTRKYDDVFKLGDTVSVLRDGYLIDSFANGGVFQEPQRLYEAFLGGSSIFSEEQFALPDGDFNVLDVVRIGTQCMFSQENVNSAFQKYAGLTEQYFSDVRCTIYVRKLGGRRQIEPYFSGQYHQDQVPLTSAPALEQILQLEKPHSMIAFDPLIHSSVEDFPYTNVLYKLIKQGDTCEGILQVSFLKPYSVSKNDVDYLQMLSDEILLILDNSRLMGNSSYLQEMNHRIKNNLQLVTSMLMLEKTHYQKAAQTNFSKADIGELIDTTIARIQSIAGIHNLLMRRDVRNDMVSLTAILDELRRFYSGSIEIRVEKSGLETPVSHSGASSFALVINELINNSVKHNPGAEGLHGRISITEKDGEVKIFYRDNGVGYSQDCLTKGVGMTVIEAIVNKELWGSIQTFNDGGACTVLRFSESSLISDPACGQ